MSPPPVATPRLRRLCLVALALIASGLTLPVARGQDSKTDSTAAEQLELERANLRAAEDKQRALEQSVEAIAKQREELNEQLILTAQRVQTSETELSDLEAQLEELGAQEKIIRASFGREQARLGKLLVALQRMGRNPPPVLITQRQDALTQVRSAMVLAAVFPELRDRAVELSAKLADFERVVKGITESRNRLSAERVRLAEEELRLDQLLAAKSAEEKARQQELIAVRRLAKTTAKTIEELNRAVKENDVVVAANTTLGAFDEEQATLVPSPEPVVPPGAEDAIVPAPEGSRTVLLDPGRIKPAFAFDKAKKRLLLPVSGRRLFGYGEKTPNGSRSQGIAYATRPRAQITSPCDGYIVYAGEFRSYGQLLIINGGGGYHVVLAGLAQINVEVGQFVLMGEPVGKMGGAAVAEGDTAKSEPPLLYVEFRKQERPVDPDPWWATEPRKVEG